MPCGTFGCWNCDKYNVVLQPAHGHLLREQTSADATNSLSRREGEMPFGKRLKDLAWRPEHIEAMRSAFEKVCEVRKLKCGPGDPRTDLIVIKIIELAKAGEADPDRLCSQALLELVDHLGSSAGTA